MSEKYIELKKENLIFEGKTEKEKKINETIFDLCLENDALYEENKDLKHILTEFEKWLEKVLEGYNDFSTGRTYEDVLDKLQELKGDKNEIKKLCKKER